MGEPLARPNPVINNPVSATLWPLLCSLCIIVHSAGTEKRWLWEGGLQCSGAIFALLRCCHFYSGKCNLHKTRTSAHPCGGGAGDAADYLPHSSYLSVSGEMISAAVLDSAVQSSTISKTIINSWFQSDIRINA